MSRAIRLYFPLLLTGFLFTNILSAQNSVLVNFGSNTCTTSSIPNFSLIKSPLTGLPVMLANCDLSAQTANFYSVFIAYNPKDNKIYLADIRDNIQTKIWVLDVGLPFNMNCPLAIPVAPTYAYSYISNNFEFDNNGDLWSFSNYNLATGQCNMDKFDVNTGTVINSRILQFPAGNFPTTIQSGDLTILPNGRMFASLGSGTCRLYEINDYSSTTTTASATFLKTLPKDCYGIAFINGTIELTGSTFNGNCYYYDYNITTGELGAEKAFQNGQLPIDNTSITPAVGCTKRLLNAIKVNSNTADLTYEIYAVNMGNVVLNNLQIMDNLAATFGAGNVSNVSANFVAGANAGGLELNAAFNGTTVTEILKQGQNLPNKILLNKNSYCKVIVNCRATNLNASTIYLNTAIAKGDIGSANTASLVNVSDSSNNGEVSMVDPNNNGNPGDAGENIPTPYVFTTLPVKFIAITASFNNKQTAQVKWTVATPLINAASFEIEYSADAINWQGIGSQLIQNVNNGQYSFTHYNISAGSKLYYRIKQIDTDGSIVYSSIVLLNNSAAANGLVVYPNPVSDRIKITSPALALGVNTTAILFDATGRILLETKIISAATNIPVGHLPNGTYLLKMITANQSTIQKIIIKH
jgi:hypothetical protein